MVEINEDKKNWRNENNGFFVSKLNGNVIMRGRYRKKNEKRNGKNKKKRNNMWKKIMNCFFSSARK